MYKGRHCVSKRIHTHIYMHTSKRMKEEHIKGAHERGLREAGGLCTVVATATDIYK